MKHSIKLILFFSLILILPGCYTVIWTPDEEFPSERDYDYHGYYPDYYYGDYYYFYDYPWWLSISPPGYVGEENYGNGRTREGTSARNTDGGRSTDRGTSSDNENIIRAAPPTRDRSSDNDNSNSGSTSTRSSNDNSSSSTPRTETERSRDSNNNSGSGSSRNNDGGRNTGGRK